MQSTEEPQRESLLQSEQGSWRQEPGSVSNAPDTRCAWHLHYRDICLHNYGKQVTLWLSALEPGWWARAWAPSPLLQEGAEATLKVETQPHSQVVFPCPVLSWRVWGQAPDRWKGWGSEPGIYVKELDSRKFPESGWPSLKVLSRLCRPLRRKLCLELFFNYGDKPWITFYSFFKLGSQLWERPQQVINKKGNVSALANPKN